ncbi:MAG TPA: hypothetical protein VFL47_09330 [Flavisolibacter sp.]|nr:hypothetical protein [Flavisolibacter sp.]
MADETFLDFQFDVVHTTTWETVLVSVYKNTRRITLFHMQKKDRNWTIVNAPKVADEYFQLEKMLDFVLKERELKTT